MREKDFYSDTSASLKLARWFVYVDEDDKLHIVQGKKGKFRELFVEESFSILILKDKNKNKEGSFYYTRRQTVDFIGSKVSKFEFIDDTKNPIVRIFLDKQEIAFEDIARFNFYARTDRGSLLVSMMPNLFNDARPIVIFHSNNPKVNTIIQHMTMFWAYEIYPAE